MLSSGARRQVRHVTWFCLALSLLFAVSMLVRLQGLFAYEYAQVIEHFSRQAQRIDAELLAVKRVNVRQGYWIGTRLDKPALDKPLDDVLGEAIRTPTHYEYRLLDDTGRPLAAIYLGSAPGQLPERDRLLLPVLQELLLFQVVNLRTNPRLQRVVFVSARADMLARAPAIRPEQEPFWPNWIETVYGYQLRQYGDLSHAPAEGWWLLPDSGRPSTRGRVRFSTPVIHRGQTLGILSTNIAISALSDIVSEDGICPQIARCALRAGAEVLVHVGKWPTGQLAPLHSQLETGNAWVDGDLRMVRALDQAPWLLVGEIEPWQLIKPLLPAALRNVALLLVLLAILLYGRHRFIRYVVLPEMKLLQDLAKARDAAEAGVRAKSTFLAVMSHEIRTPMTGVLGMLDVLEHTRLGTDQRRAVSIIRSSSLTLLRLIDDILDFSKIEAGKLTLEPEACDFQALLGQIVELYAGSARSKGVQLRGYAAPEFGVYFIDPIRVRQIVGNLLSNAIKFTSAGGMVVVESEIDPNGDARIRVADTGIGIAESHLPFLFLPFSQAEGTASRRFRGTGLGLSITKHLVELMKGQIQTTSVLGTGSVFTVSLPLDPAAPPAATESADLSDLRVCLVCNDPMDERWFVRYLISGGAAVGVDYEAGHDCWGPAWDVVVCERSLLPLGLSDGDLARTVVFAHEDSEDYSLEGDGTVVRTGNRIELLRAVAAAAESASAKCTHERQLRLPETSVAVANGPETTERALLLLVEDNLFNQEVISQQLSLLGYSVHTAIDGTQALEALRGNSYCLILTDCHMPEMDGYQLAAAIRASEIGTDLHMPIIALTASALREEADRCHAAGMDDYLTKPADMDALERTIKKWLKPPMLTSFQFSDTQS
jgi:signal transduction histidine kinase/CheY-like chemotaxis protein